MNNKEKEERTVSLLIAFLIFLIWILSLLVMKSNTEVKYYPNKSIIKNINHYERV